MTVGGSGSAQRSSVASLMQQLNGDMGRIAAMLDDRHTHWCVQKKTACVWVYMAEAQIDYI